MDVFNAYFFVALSSLFVYFQVARFVHCIHGCIMLSYSHAKDSGTPTAGGGRCTAP